MEIAIGIPTDVVDAGRPEVVSFCLGAEAAGFSALGVRERLVYPSLDAMTVLTVAAALTEKIRLLPSVLLAPLHGNGAMLVKRATTINQLAGGERLTLGLAVGSRRDDYEAAGIEFERRGALLDELARQLRATRNGAVAVGSPSREKVTQDAGILLSGPDDIPLLFGGTSRASFRRVAQFGDGWIGGHGSVQDFESHAEQVRLAWSASGRMGTPRFVAMANTSLGPNGEETAKRVLGAYYRHRSPDGAPAASLALTTPKGLRTYVDRLAECGCDEVILFPCSIDADSIKRLAQMRS